MIGILVGTPFRIVRSNTFWLGVDESWIRWKTDRFLPGAVYPIVHRAIKSKIAGYTFCSSKRLIMSFSSHRSVLKKKIKQSKNLHFLLIVQVIHIH